VCVHVCVPSLADKIGGQNRSWSCK
jgi:hypothetical protein